jgi:hypothetical protein
MTGDSGPGIKQCIRTLRLSPLREGFPVQWSGQIWSGG